MITEHRVTVVVLTHDRPDELAAVLGRLDALPDRAAIVVVDNASTCDVRGVLGGLEHVEYVRCPRNLGAAGRNAGVARAGTPYVAFCDDDTWWAPGALAHAADLLDAHPAVALLSARILIADDGTEDPVCTAMADSPLDSSGLPGPAIVSFMAGAAVVRVSEFRAVNGYEARLFLGAEEWLMSLDLLARGRSLVYAPDLIVHHRPSERARDPRRRHIALLRNRIWIAWMRLPVGHAWRITLRALAAAWQQRLTGAVVGRTLAGLSWALRRRRVVPTDVVRLLSVLSRHRRARHRAIIEAAAGTPLQRERA
ncbi:MAG TPA: glycosyltransferase [Burkholderiaceae bacterium]|nr:glycosyltransferase [Burkholderiaceae bacterium]